MVLPLGERKRSEEEKIKNDNKLSCQGKYWCLRAQESVSLRSCCSPNRNQKQTELFLSARGYFRIQPPQHKLFMSMLCPIPHTVLLILSLSRAQPNKGLISNNYLIATPLYFSAAAGVSCGDARGKHRANVPFLVTESQGMRAEQGKSWVEAEAAGRESLLGFGLAPAPGDHSIPAAPRGS